MGRGGNNLLYQGGLLRHSSRETPEYSQLLQPFANYRNPDFNKTLVAFLNGRGKYRFFEELEQEIDGDREYFSGSDQMFLRKQEFPEIVTKIDINQYDIKFQLVNDFESDDLRYTLNNLAAFSSGRMLDNSSEIDLEIEAEHLTQQLVLKVNHDNKAFASAQTETFITLGEMMMVEKTFGNQGEWRFTNKMPYPGALIYSIDEKPMGLISCAAYCKDYL